MREPLQFGHLPCVVIVQYTYFVAFIYIINHYCVCCCVGYQKDAIVCSIEAVACSFESDEVIEQLARGTTHLLFALGSLTSANCDPYQTRSVATH